MNNWLQITCVYYRSLKKSGQVWLDAWDLNVNMKDK